MVTEVKLEQPLKARTLMVVTPLPIFTEVKPEQPLKVSEPMLVTLLGIVTELEPEQPEYLQILLYQLLVG